MTRTVLGLIGFAGAGKTSASESLVEANPSHYKIEMSTIAGKIYESVEEEGVSYFSESFVQQAEDQQLADDIIPSESIPKVDELGDWVNAVLQVAPKFFAERLSEYIQQETSEDSVIFVDGVRTNADVDALQSGPFKFELICIYSPFHVRLERLQQRARGSESDMTSEDLMYRDKQELSWGVDDILSDEQANYFYNNYESLERFQDQFNRFVDTVVSDN